MRLEEMNVEPFTTAGGNNYADEEISSATRLLLRITRDYTPPMWFFLMGIMFLWGAWIVFGVTVQAIRRFKARRVRKYKPDPVELEYRRLKDMSSDGIELGGI